ncbi:hypothetical protein, partial [Streptomyces anthocyanicus]|uniref:hypothetical protein n=1 Tax=Streptomyces anthocyanicus TaxID=68174 RepID=UPI003649423A
MALALVIALGGGVGVVRRGVLRVVALPLVIALALALVVALALALFVALALVVALLGVRVRLLLVRVGVLLGVALLVVPGGVPLLGVGRVLARGVPLVRLGGLLTGDGGGDGRVVGVLGGGLGLGGGAQAAGAAAVAFGVAEADPAGLAGALSPFLSRATSSRSMFQILSAEAFGFSQASGFGGYGSVGMVTVESRSTFTFFSCMPRSKSLATVSRPSETWSAFVPVSARPISRPVSVQAFCCWSFFSMPLRYMCWALARFWSLPKACRVRS